MGTRMHTGMLSKMLRFFFVHLWATWASTPQRHPERDIQVGEGICQALGDLEHNLSLKRWTFLFSLRERGQERGNAPAIMARRGPQRPGGLLHLCWGGESWAPGQGWATTWSGLGWGGVTSCPTPPSPWAGLPIHRKRAPSAYPGVGFPKAKWLKAHHCSEVPLSFNDHPAENSSKNKVRFLNPKQSQRQLKGGAISGQVLNTRHPVQGSHSRTQTLTPCSPLWSSKMTSHFVFKMGLI